LATIHQRHRQTGQDNGPIAQGEPFYKRSPKINCKNNTVSKYILLSHTTMA